MTLHDKVDAHAAQAQAEIREMAQRAKDELHIKVGWMNRSSGQIRRYRLAQKELTSERNSL